MNKRSGLALLAALLWVGAAQAGGAALGQNLLKNGGAESGPGSPDGGPVDSVPKWQTSGGFTVVQYGAPAFPDESSPGSPRRRLNFFAGGPDNAQSSAVKTVSLKALAEAIDGGAVRATLVGYLGGFSSQEDHADLQVEFLDAAEQPLSSLALPGVSAADRGFVTGLLKRSAKAAVPVGARSARVVLTMTRTAGSYNDGYADALSLVLE